MVSLRCSLLLPAPSAAFSFALLACGGPAEPPVDDTTPTQTTTTTAATGSTTTTGSTTSNVDASDESGPPECTVGNHDCPPGEGCSQPNNYDPPFCEPIPEGGCTNVDPCPEGLVCESGSHHTEIGTCVPPEPETSSSGSSGESSGSSGESSSTTSPG